MPTAKPQTGNIGYWALLIGILIAIIAGLAAAAQLYQDPQGVVAAILVVLGIVIGFLNILDKDLNTFLIAVIGLSVGLYGFASLGQVGTYLTSMLENVRAFVWPAAVIVSLKIIWDLASK